MVAENFGPIVHNLVLILALRQRAVAAVHVQAAAVLRPDTGTLGRGSQLSSAWILNIERRSATSETVAQVGIRNSQLILKVRSLVVLTCDGVVPVIAQPEVRQQGGIDCHVSARGDAVVGAHRRAAVIIESEARAARRPEDGRSSQ